MAGNSVARAVADILRRPRMNAPASHSRRRSLASIALMAAITLFAASRLWILTTAKIEQSTVGVFTMAGYDYRFARAHGESVYDVHTRRVRAERESRPQAPPPETDPSRERLEYPPLAVAWMALPTFFAPPPGPAWE